MPFCKDQGVCALQRKMRRREKIMHNKRIEWIRIVVIIVHVKILKFRT